MIKTSFKVSDSHKLQDNISGDTDSQISKLRFRFIDKIEIAISFEFESNGKNLKITDAKLERIETEQNGELSINLSFNNTIHQGSQAVRITINLAYESYNQSAVGSSIVKLTPKGEFIQYTKTDNVSDLNS